MRDPIYSRVRHPQTSRNTNLSFIHSSLARAHACTHTRTRVAGIFVARSMSEAIGGLDAVVGLGSPFDADFVRRLVHEGLQRIVESDHEVGMMNRRLSAREDRGEGLVSVGKDVPEFVSFPNVENFGDIQVVGILVLFAKILHEGSLEADLFVTVFQVQLFLFPFVSISHHGLLRRQLNVAHNDVARPKTLLVKHGEGVILILGPDVEKLAITAFEEEAAFVQIRREQSVPALQSELVGEEWISVEISSAEEDGVNVSAAAILEVNRVTLDLGQQRSLFDRFGPVVSHGLGSPGADDVFGAIFDALKGDVLGGIRSANQEQSLARELVGVTEVVRVHHATGELFNAGEGRDVRGGIVTGGHNDVGEALRGQHDIVLQILNNDGEVVGIFVVND